MLDYLLGAFLTIQVTGMAILYWRISRLDAFLREPIRRLVTSKGLDVAPVYNTDYWKMKRDEYAKEHPSWRLYNKRYQDSLQ